MDIVKKETRGAILILILIVEILTSFIGIAFGQAYIDNNVVLQNMIPFPILYVSLFGIGATIILFVLGIIVLRKYRKS